MQATNQIEVFEALEAQIAREFEQKAAMGKGCFGSLLFAADSEECKACELCEACEEAHAKSRLDDMAGVEVEIETEALEVEALEFTKHEEEKAAGTFNIEERKSELETPALEVPEISIPEIEVPEIALEASEEQSAPTESEEASSEERATAKAKRAAAKRTAETKSEDGTISAKLTHDVNWDHVRDLIAEARPTVYKDAVAIVLKDLLAQGLPEAFAKKNRYRYAQRVFNALQAKELLTWSLEERTITWK